MKKSIFAILLWMCWPNWLGYRVQTVLSWRVITSGLTSKYLFIDLGDLNFLGMRWKGQLYIDMTIAAGLLSLTMCCQRSNLSWDWKGSRGCDNRHLFARLWGIVPYPEGIFTCTDSRKCTGGWVSMSWIYWQLLQQQMCRENCSVGCAS